MASIIAKRTDRALRRLNGTNASTADIRALVAELDTLSAPNGILLYLDEIQYFNKRQQQSLLEYIENGKITLIASTTENPYFYIYPAVLSRCTVFEFKSVTPADVVPAVERGFRLLEEENGSPVELADGVARTLAERGGGDVRKSLGAVENCYFAAQETDGKKRITPELVDQLTQKAAPAMIGWATSITILFLPTKIYAGLGPGRCAPLFGAAAGGGGSALRLSAADGLCL